MLDARHCKPRGMVDVGPLGAKGSRQGAVMQRPDLKETRLEGDYKHVGQQKWIIESENGGAQ
eukprot:3017363-Pyramimonas_sp.AAC.1